MIFKFKTKEVFSFFIIVLFVTACMVKPIKPRLLQDEKFIAGKKSGQLQNDLKTCADQAEKSSDKSLGNFTKEILIEPNEVTSEMPLKALGEGGIGAVSGAILFSLLGAPADMGALMGGSMGTVRGGVRGAQEGPIENAEESYRMVRASLVMCLTDKGYAMTQ